MPKIKAKLTEIQIKNAKPKASAYKLYDEGGLLLLVRPTGTKVWQYPYRVGGKYNICTIGQYPEVGAAEARRLRDDIKRQVKAGEDPNRIKKASQGQPDTTFEAVGRDWYGKQVWAEKHAKSILRTLEADVFSVIGHKQIAKVTAQDIIGLLQDIEGRGAIDVAKRVNQRCVAIFDHAIAKNLCEFNPALGRSKILKKQEVKHRPSLTADQLPKYLQKLESYRGGKIVKLALKLLSLTFVRPGELRGARWTEFDEKKAEWRIPAERMKMDRPHIVPLSKQALAVLAELREISGKTSLLFPGERGADKPISDVTLLKALKIMGYVGDAKVVPHGMRHTASTILHENGFKTEVIEAQLAHKDKNKVRSTYNHALYLDDRKTLMQWWADYLTEKMAVDVKPQKFLKDE